MEDKRIPLREKLFELMKQKRIKSVPKLLQLMVDKFKDEAISKAGLYLILSSSQKTKTIKPHVKTLEQLASVLDISINKLLEGTILEPTLVGPSQGKGKELNSTSTLRNLFTGLPVRPRILTISGLGETTDLRSFSFDSKCFRLAWVLKGQTELILMHKDKAEERKQLMKGDCYCFDWSIPHIFRNMVNDTTQIHLTDFREGSPLE